MREISGRVQICEMIETSRWLSLKGTVGPF